MPPGGVASYEPRPSIIPSSTEGAQSLLAAAAAAAAAATTQITVRKNAPASAASLRHEEQAKNLFLKAKKEAEESEEWDQLTPETEYTVQLLKPDIHLTNYCWEHFDCFVKTHKGWTAKRRVASDEEKEKLGVKRKCKVYFVDVVYKTPTEAVDGTTKEPAADVTCTAAAAAAVERKPKAPPASLDSLSREDAAKKKFIIAKGLMEQKADQLIPGTEYTVHLLEPNIHDHLTNYCWRRFVRFVKQHEGWTAKRREANQEEKKKSGKTYKWKSYFVYVVYKLPEKTAKKHAAPIDDTAKKPAKKQKLGDSTNATS
jgi:hypothetical protein